MKSFIGDDKSGLKRQDNVEDLTKIDDKTSKTVKIKELKADKEKKKLLKQLYFDDELDDDDDDDEVQEDGNNVEGKVEGETNNLNGDDDLDKTGYNEEYYSDYEQDDDGETAVKNIDDQLSINDDVIDDIIEADKIHASINQYKMKFLGSVRGMNDFRDFLKFTSNCGRFIKYWLDCEFYRDSMQDYDQIENMATRNRLFRDINEKYVFAFSSKVHEKIKSNYSDQYGLNHQVFERIQYDILRRLRSYWVPRFILNRLKTSGKNYGNYPLPPLTPEYSRQSTYNTVPSAAKTNFNLKTKPIDKDTVLTDVQKK